MVDHAKLATHHVQLLQVKKLGNCGGKVKQIHIQAVSFSRGNYISSVHLNLIISYGFGFL